MLSGREQELAGRLREAASQVIAHDDTVDGIGMMLMMIMMMMIIWWNDIEIKLLRSDDKMIKCYYVNPTGRHKSGANTVGGRGTLCCWLGENHFEYFECYLDDMIRYYNIMGHPLLSTRWESFLFLLDESTQKDNRSLIT